MKLTHIDDLRAALTHFAARSGEKLRHQNLTAQAMTVFIQTSPFDTHYQYTNSATTEFDRPTQAGTIDD